MATANRLGILTRRLLAAVSHRRSLATLETLDDRTLRDIGLTRGELGKRRRPQ